MSTQVITGEGNAWTILSTISDYYVSKIKHNKNYLEILYLGKEKVYIII